MHKSTNKLNSICKCFTPKQQQQQEQQLKQKHNKNKKQPVDKVHQKQKRKENMRTNKNAKLINKPNNNIQIEATEAAHCVYAMWPNKLAY